MKKWLRERAYDSFLSTVVKGRLWLGDSECTTGLSDSSRMSQMHISRSYGQIIGENSHLFAPPIGRSEMLSFIELQASRVTRYFCKPEPADNRSKQGFSLF